MDIEQIIENAYKYWTCFFVPELDQKQVRATVMREFDRSQNSLLIDEIENKAGIKININVNQETDAFIKQLKAAGRLDNALISEILG